LDKRTTVYLRADGNSKIGLGHIHRLLALGEMLRDRFSCTFLIKAPLVGVKDLIVKNGFQLTEINGKDEITELTEIKSLLTGKEIVVLDGYNFGTQYQKELQQCGSKLVCIDDIHQVHFTADIVINPAGGIDSASYSKEPDTNLFIGPAYALVKKPFQTTQPMTDVRSGGFSILICMGGADPGNETALALEKCLPFPFEVCYVVVGEAYQHSNILSDRIAIVGRNIEVLFDLEAADLARVMSKCTFAICSASGIAYEYLSISGELYIKQTAANQGNMYRYLIENDLAFPIEKLRIGLDEIKSSMLKQKKIFDGGSGRRIQKILNGLDFDLYGHVRKANAQDLLVFFDWANDNELRKQSFNTEPIAIEVHTAWYTRKMSDPNAVMYLFSYKDVPVAQVRFEIKEDAIISYSVGKDFRGMGWGQKILQQSIREFKREHPGAIKIVGFVKLENEVSNRIFTNLGFVQQRATEYFQTYKYVNHD
jgi:UDP-2,4-diacetamido-2,4,6-trideoxy-beta-L-altropyranose hydrolase